MHLLAKLLLLGGTLPAATLAQSAIYISTPSGAMAGVPTNITYSAPNMTDVSTPDVLDLLHTAFEIVLTDRDSR